jgi:hypothetical protein
MRGEPGGRSEPMYRPSSRLRRLSVAVSELARRTRRHRRQAIAGIVLGQRRFEVTRDHPLRKPTVSFVPGFATKMGSELLRLNRDQVVQMRHDADKSVEPSTLGEQSAAGGTMTEYRARCSRCARQMNVSEYEIINLQRRQLVHQPVCFGRSVQVSRRPRASH